MLPPIQSPTCQFSSTILTPPPPLPQECSNNSRRDINRTHFGLGFFAFPNWSCKTTPSVKKSLQKGQCKGQLLGLKIVEFAASKKILYFQLMDRQNLSLPISLQILSLSLFLLWNKIVWIHTFLRHG